MVEREREKLQCRLLKIIFKLLKNYFLNKKKILKIVLVAFEIRKEIKISLKSIALKIILNYFLRLYFLKLVTSLRSQKQKMGKNNARGPQTRSCTPYVMKELI